MTDKRATGAGTRARRPKAGTPSAGIPSAGASVQRRAGGFALGTMGSRILGAARDIMLTAVFSVASIDAFVVAFTIPNTLRALIAEGASQTALVPLYARLRRVSSGAAGRFFSRALGLTLLVAGSAGLVLSLAATQVIDIVAPGLAPEVRAAAATLLRSWGPYVPFLAWLALSTGVLTTEGMMRVAGALPALLNLGFCLTLGCIIAVRTWTGFAPDVAWLALAVWLGAGMQTFLATQALRRTPAAPWPALPRRTPHMRAYAALLAPTLALTLAHQAQVLGVRFLASFQGLGAQSYLYLGQRLIEVPHGLVTAALGTALLPALSGERRASERLDVFRQTLGAAFVLLVPVNVALWVLAEPIVTLLFERGAFGAADTANTAATLRWQALALLPTASARLLGHRAFAERRPREVIWAQLTMLGTFATMVWPLIQLNGPTRGYVGIAQALAAASLCYALTLGVFARQALAAGGQPQPTLVPWTDLMRVLTAGLVAGAAAHTLQRVVPATWPALLKLALLGSALGLSYAIAVRALSGPDGASWQVLRRLGTLLRRKN